MSRFQEAEVHFEGRFRSTVLDTLKQAYWGNRYRILLCLVLGFVGRLFLLSNANLIGLWVDSMCVEGPKAQCRALPSIFAGFQQTDFLFLVIAATVLGFVLTLAFRVGFSRSSARSVSLLYDEVTLRTSRMPMSFFDVTPVGRIVTRFSSDYGNVFRIFGGPISEFIALIYDIVAILFLISLTAPMFLPLFGGVALVNYALFCLNRDTLRKNRRDMSYYRGPSISHFSETTQGAGSVRVYGRLKSFAERFRNLDYLYNSQKGRTISSVLKFSLQMASAASLLLLFTGLVGLWLVKEGWTSVGSVGVALTFVVLVGQSLQWLFEWVMQMEEAMTGVERLDQYLRSPIESGSVLPVTANIKTGHPVHSKIAIGDNTVSVASASQPKQAFVEKESANILVRDLSLQYSAQGSTILKNISFEINPGEQVGLVGRTGSGKSSLVQAIYYLYPFLSGDVSIDHQVPDVDCLKGLAHVGQFSKIPLEDYRSRLSWVTQEPILFRGTLRENLDMTQKHTDARLYEVLRQVGLETWFKNQGFGFEMQIEERGRNVSQGEKQLICMARVILQNAPVVILDEATSFMDPMTESLLIDATLHHFQKKTQLIIAHRLSTLEKCDRILWVHQGEIEMYDKSDLVLNAFRRFKMNDHRSPQL